MIKVLIVDDSVLFSSLLKTRLSQYDEITVVGTAENPYEARDKILELEPDVMTLDIEMPRMDGVRFLKKLLPQYQLPVIMISSLESRSAEAVGAGAESFHVKPSLSDSGAVNYFIKKIAEDIISAGRREAARLDAARRAEEARRPVMPEPVKGTVEIIALGASTGGTDALEAVVSKLPKNSPPVIITQHMPPVFTKMYAERLNRSSALAVFEAKDGMRLERGMCIVAEGGKHLELCRDGRGYYITSREGEKVSGHCPSVDVMFTSAAKVCGKSVVAALLTGMGADGAEGLLKLRKTGAYTIGQDKETCVVYGMPMEAYKMGAVCEQAPLGEIANIIIRRVSGR